MIVRRPVKVALTMEEQFYTITKHPSTFRIKTGVDKNGRITARKCEVYWNGGAYADIGPRVTQKSGFTASGPYDIDNVWINSYALYTNVPPAGALRGFGIPQLVWAYESHTDMMARALKVDPLEFRRKNILREGRPHATGKFCENASIERVLERVAERLNWTKPFDRGTGTLRRGRGFAIAIKAVISPTTSVAIVNIAGRRQHHASIAAPSTWARARTPRWRRWSARCSTSRPRACGSCRATPTSRPTTWARSARARCSTWATRCGSRPRKRATRSRRSRARSASPKAATFRSPSCSRRNTACRPATSSAPASTSRITCRRDPATGLTPNVTPFWMCAAAGAEVEVDTETGQVKIARLINVVDCGTPINPKIVETQISGASLMQLGFTMFEKMHLDGGQVTNASLADYKIPGILDLPRGDGERGGRAHQSNGPFGAKGVGEIATFCVSPAIANAIADAVGVRLTELPLNAEAVFRALRANADKPLGDE